MTSIRLPRVAGLAAGVTLSIASLATLPAASATASHTPPAACAQQQSQVDKAEDALARVTAVFERTRAKVAKAHDRAEAADTAHERNAARKALREAKADRAEATKVKKAQQQRLAKAQERLAACQADEPDQG